MIRLDGKLVSQTRRQTLKEKVASFSAQYHRSPHLVVLLIGEDPASQVYVRNKVKSCEEVGMRSTRKIFQKSMSSQELLKELLQLNTDPDVDGILVQLPLPSHLSDSLVNENIDVLKDVDGFSYLSLGYLWGSHPTPAGHSPIAPCTPKGVMSILEHYNIPVEGKHAVVVGRSNIVGKPMAHLLTQAHATVTLCHSKTKNLSEYTRQGDIVVVAAGKPRFLGRDDFQKGSVVIDVGIHGAGIQGTTVPHSTLGSICGDVRFEELDSWVAAATPVPGGVGPMTITTLLENTLELAQQRMSQSRNLSK